MPWTYTQVKAADLALSPAIADPAAAAAALNAQTTTVVPSYNWSAIKTVVQVSGSWSNIVVRARQTPNIPPTTSTDAAILAAINACETSDDLPIYPSNTTAMTRISAGLGALLAVGDITTSDVAAIDALASATVPVWQPSLAGGDIQTARNQ